MKTNKKAILGFAVAMIFSLAIMQGVNTKNKKQDISMQQVGLGASIVAGNTEGGMSSAANYVANTCSNVGSALVVGGVATSYVSTTTPVGWGYWIGTGAVLL